MVVGRVELKRTGKGWWWVGLGIPGWRRGYPVMRYSGFFQATGWKQISMERGEVRATPLPGLFRVKGEVLGFPWDAFYMRNPILFQIQSNIPFDLVVQGRKIARTKFAVVPLTPL